MTFANMPDGGDQTQIGRGLASWQWIGWIGVADCYVRNHPPLRLIVDPNRRLVPRLRAALVL